MVWERSFKNAHAPNVCAHRHRRGLTMAPAGNANMSPYLRRENSLPLFLNIQALCENVDQMKLNWQHYLPFPLLNWSLLCPSAGKYTLRDMTIFIKPARANMVPSLTNCFLSCILCRFLARWLNLLCMQTCFDTACKLGRAWAEWALQERRDVIS